MARRAVTGPDAFEQLEQPEPGQLVAGVVGQAEQADQILHVGGLEEPQPAVLHVGDAAARELELEQVAVVRGPDQHRLLPQLRCRPPVGQDPFAHRGDLASSSAQRTSCGGRPEPATDRSRAMNPAGASALTALATSRIGWVER